MQELELCPGCVASSGSSSVHQRIRVRQLHLRFETKKSWKTTIELDRYTLCVRHVLGQCTWRAHVRSAKFRATTSSCSELAHVWLNVAQQHQVVPASRSHHAGKWLHVRRVFFMNHRFCGFISGSRKKFSVWPNLWDRVVQSRRFEYNTDMNVKSMVYHTSDTRVRLPASEDVEVTPTDSDSHVFLASSLGLAVCNGCAYETGTLLRCPRSMLSSPIRVTCSLTSGSISVNDIKFYMVHYNIIDAQGHRDFTMNMTAGAAQTGRRRRGSEI